LGVLQIHRRLKVQKYTIAWPQTASGCSQCDRLWNQVAWREPSPPRKLLAGAIGLVSQTEVLAGVLAGRQRTAAPSIRRMDFPLTDVSRLRIEQCLRYKDQREQKSYINKEPRKYSKPSLLEVFSFGSSFLGQRVSTATPASSTDSAISVRRLFLVPVSGTIRCSKCGHNEAVYRARLPRDKHQSRYLLSRSLNTVAVDLHQPWHCLRRPLCVCHYVAAMFQKINPMNRTP